MALSPSQSPLHSGQIRIDRHEYDDLLSVKLKYENLCQNLIRGGVDMKAVELLSAAQTDKNIRESSDDSSEWTPEESPSTSVDTVDSYRCHKASYGRTSHQSYAAAANDFEQDSDAQSRSSLESSVSRDLISFDPHDSTSAYSHRLVYQQNATRTLQLDNLPAHTTHSDIIAAIRGGPLVDIYINFRKHMAAVSFVHEEHAKKYYDFAHSTGLYIGGSAIHVSWSIRQFALAPYVAKQLRGGASRNLVIRNYDDCITAESVRADLEHIHNLAVTKVDFFGVDCHIGTNSIPAASFARTCMMSRFPYRASRIEWAPDECAQPIDQFLKPPKKDGRCNAHAQMPCTLNRFALLEMDDECEA